MHVTYLFVGCHILMRGSFKIRSRNAFLRTLQDLNHTLITWPLASEWTLICHTTMCRNTINVLYSPRYVNLWCLEVVPVVYAWLGRSSTGEISCLKWRNTHAQLTMWYSSANYSRNDENKHDTKSSKSQFNLLCTVDLNSSTLILKNLCDIHRILKDNSWMCILY